MIVELFSMMVGLMLTGVVLSVGFGATFFGLLSEEGAVMGAVFLRGFEAGLVEFWGGVFLAGTGEDRLELESLLLKMLLLVFIRICARSRSCRSFSSTCRSKCSMIICVSRARSLKIGI